MREKSDKRSTTGWVEECDKPENREKYEIYWDYYFPVNEHEEKTIAYMEKTYGVDDYNAKPVFI